MCGRHLHLKAIKPTADVETVSDFYQVLGVEPRATGAEIHRAWQVKLKAIDPAAIETLPVAEQARARAEIRDMFQAYEVLKNAARRADYDRKFVRVGAGQQDSEESRGAHFRPSAPEPPNHGSHFYRHPVLDFPPATNDPEQTVDAEEATIAPEEGGVVHEVAPVFVANGPPVIQFTPELRTKLAASAVVGLVALGLNVGAISLSAICVVLVFVTTPVGMATSYVRSPRRRRQAQWATVLMSVLVMTMATPGLKPGTASEQGANAVEPPSASSVAAEAGLE